MYQKITIRKGGTFRKAGFVLKPGVLARDKPTPVDITGWGITAAIKKDAKIVATLAVRVIDASVGRYELYFKDTSLWPVGDMLMDICYTLPPVGEDPGDVYYTPSTTVSCIKTETPRPTV